MGVLGSAAGVFNAVRVGFLRSPAEKSRFILGAAAGIFRESRNVSRGKGCGIFARWDAEG